VKEAFGLAATPHGETFSEACAVRREILTQGLSRRSLAKADVSRHSFHGNGFIGGKGLRGPCPIRCEKMNRAKYIFNVPQIEEKCYLLLSCFYGSNSGTLFNNLIDIIPG